MAFDLFSDLSIHLTESQIPSPLSLGGLVEASFSGYTPSGVGSVVSNRIKTGMTVFRCVAEFFNAGIVGSAVPTGAFLVSGKAPSAKLVAFVALPYGSYLPIPHGSFTLNCNFIFNAEGD